MKLKTLLIAALTATSFSAMAWGPFNGFNNGYNNGGYSNNGNGTGTGSFMGDGNFGFNMKANARGNGNGNASSNNGYNNGGYANNTTNGNFDGDASFGFNMNANARGNGNGNGSTWGNSYNGNNPAYRAPAMTKDQQKAQADYYKNAEQQRQAFYKAEKKAYDDYVAMMQKRANNK